MRRILDEEFLVLTMNTVCGKTVVHPNGDVKYPCGREQTRKIYERLITETKYKRGMFHFEQFILRWKTLECPDCGRMEYPMLLDIWDGE